MFLKIPNRQLVGTIAGIGFILIPAYMLYSEIQGLKDKIHLTALSVFIVAALPIIGLRVFYWGEDFDGQSFLGIPAVSFHQFSRYSYMVMMVSTLYMFWKTRK